jgi:hypothetical protein
LIPSPESFLVVYFSGKKIASDSWCSNSKILIWDVTTNGELYTFIMSPKTYSEYKEFVLKLETESPLLAELK